MTTENKAGRYQLLEELGRGAMGVVWKGHDPMIGRTVAIKLMKLTEEGTGLSRQDLIARFQNETRAAGLLTHPNIVTIYDAGEDGGNFYITMEYIQGQSLQSLLDRKQVFPVPRIMKVMEQACNALGFAHEHKVIHRDVKPANIMLMPDDTVKVTDFGTAKILQLSTTMTGQIVGTPSYMSPEQVKGRAVDGRSDIFALGVVLYELVTGEKPFPGQNVTTVIYKIVHEDPISPIELDSSVHPGLNEVISKALEKDPDRRYQSCREFFEDLRSYRDLGAGRESGATIVMTGRPREVIEATQALPKKPPEERAGTLTGVPIPPLAQPVDTVAPPPPAKPAVAEVPTPRPSKTLPPLPYKTVEKPEKSHAGVWLSLVAMVVLAVGGYLMWPQIQEIIGGRPAVTQPAAEPAPAPNGAETKAPVSAPPPAAAGEERPDEPAPSKAAESTPVEAKPAETKAAPPKAEPRKVDAAALRRRIEQRLARAGLARKVRVSVNQDGVTLSGSLKPAEYRQLLQQVRQQLPAEFQLNDQIEVAAAEGDERPSTAPGRGEVEVVTDVMGARAVLTGPGGATQECRTPCRFEELPPGRYTMEVSQAGYRPERRILQVNAGHIKEVQLKFQPYSSGLSIITRPAGADVYLNGRKHSEPTPATVMLPPGKYSVRLERSGFQGYEETVELTADSLKQLSVSLVQARSGVGIVEVRTVPPGADIIVNGTNTGRRTPFTMELKAGEHTLTLYLRGYKAVNKKITVETNGTVSVNEILPR